jgi:hypothetical protein
VEVNHLDPKETLLVSNLDDEPRTVILSESANHVYCADASRRLTVSAHSTSLIPVAETTQPYLLFTKPERVLVSDYHHMEGTTSTFNVDSGITFGSPVRRNSSSLYASPMAHHFVVGDTLQTLLRAARGPIKLVPWGQEWASNCHSDLSRPSDKGDAFL